MLAALELAHFSIYLFYDRQVNHTHPQQSTYEFDYVTYRISYYPPHAPLLLNNKHSIAIDASRLHKMFFNLWST